MKKQVVFIHGGETFESYEDYLEDLNSQKYDPYEERQERWKDTLSEELGESYEVFQPTMPLGGNAKYVEWEIFFEKLIPYLEGGVIFVGHSLGGIFLAKYFTENDLPVKTKAMYLVSAPFDEDKSNESLADFVLPDSLERFEKQVGDITLYHSEDDPVVPFADVKKNEKALSSAKLVTFTERGHFLQSEFPEILSDIRKKE